MKKYLALLLALVMVFALCACGSKNETPAPAGSDDAAAPAAGGKLTMSTGNSSGTYFAFGTVLANHVGEKTDTDITAVEGKGSQGNIELMQAGEVQMAFCQSDVASYAYNGTNLFEESGAVTDFSVVAALYMEQVQIVTLDENIKSVADLAGKTVSIGEAGSGVYFNALDILGAYDLTEDDITPVYQSFSDSADSLKDGKIDAAFIVAGAPTTAITDLATGGKQVYLVGLDDAHVDALVAASPFYSKNVIPAGTYNGQAEDVSTVAIAALVLARNDVADVDVYNFVSSIFDNIEEVTAAHAKGAELDPEFAFSVEGIPYHPGAIQYFEAQG